MDNLCNKYIVEFSQRLISAFSIDAPVGKLVEMWAAVVADGRVSVAFPNSVTFPNSVAGPDIKKASCPKLLASGANKGTACGKKCAGDSPFCAKHGGNQSTGEKIDANITCSYLMVSGAKKGMACGKKCPEDSDLCSVHKAKGKPNASAPPTKSGEPAKSGEPTTYKVTFKQRESGLLAAINATPSGSIFVFNNTKDRLISGKLGPDDRVIPLDEDDVDFCRENNLKMVSVISSKLAIEEILDEIQHE